ELAGGRIGHSQRVVDAFKAHKGAQAGTATALTDEGWTITDEIAGELVAAAHRLLVAQKEG
ncbi:MAG: putative zinc-binding protein, partial [Chloroflexota bacterium]